MKFYTNVSRRGNKILVREVVDGNHTQYTDAFEPTLYIKSNREESFKTMTGDFARAVKHASIAEAKSWVEQYTEVNGVEIFGMTDWVLQYISQNRAINPAFDKLSVWSMDIETALAKDENGNEIFPNPRDAGGEVLLITIVNQMTGKSFTFGSKQYSGKDTNYIFCQNESDLFTKFLMFWRQVDPDIVTGWNVEGFDIPYLINRGTQIVGKEIEKLSPWGEVNTFIKTFNGEEELKFRLIGISVLDYMVLYKKYSTAGKKESYSLAFISQEELGTTKLDHSEFKTWTEFHENGWDKFVSYNVIDALLVKQLNDRLKFLQLVTTIAYGAGVNFEDVASPVKTWDTIIHAFCLERNIVIPQRNNEALRHIEGAYVKDPTPGRYHNVCSLDATSLYPSIIITNNISPETFVGNIPDVTVETMLSGKDKSPSEEYVMTPVGALYSRDKVGILPQLMINYMKERKEVKSLMLQKEQELENTTDESLRLSLESNIAMLDAKQLAIKILLNSLYGATGNKGFRYFKWEHASSITGTGQYLLRSIEKHIDNVLNKKFKTQHQYLIYGDTDSVLFDLDAVIRDKIPNDKIRVSIEKIATDLIRPEVNKICSECCEQMNSKENKINFKLEVAAPSYKTESGYTTSAIWLAKKKYVIRVESSEGVVYKEPKYKTMGLEMVRSSTPMFIRGELKKAIDYVFDKTESETQDFIDSVKEQFNTLHYSQIAFPRTANGLKEYSDASSIYKKGTPIHVRGVLLYNYYLDKFKLTQYKKIGEGEKIKFIYLKVPNSIRENIIAFPSEGEIPEEFNIIGSIDKELQFSKVFVGPMQILLTPIGWNAERIATLDDFFG